jgi:hypothetical protein
LDIIEIPLLRAEPRRHQTENHVVDSGGGWARRGQFPWDQLEAIRDRPRSLWINRDSSSTGAYDRISHAEAATIHSSLLLVRPWNFSVELGRNSRGRTFRGSFSYRGIHYNFSVTDPVVRDVFAPKEDGGYPLNDIYLCLSLTEPYKDDKCYKLVAAIVSQQPLRIN